MRVLHRGDGVVGLYVEAVDIVQFAIPRFGHHRERPPVFKRNRGSVLYLPVDNGVAYYAHAVRVGDHHGAIEKTGFLDPRGASYLAIAIFREPSSKYGIHGGFSSGENCRDTGANRSDTNLQLSFTADQGAIANLDSFDVCDRIERTGCSFKWNSEVASTLSDLGARVCDTTNQDEQNRDGVNLHRWSPAAIESSSFFTRCSSSVFFISADSKIFACSETRAQSPASAASVSPGNSG